ncbi:unnamed protein product [marine sediment metagenome]|uniref:Uncharacterized protein n=2 Tax=marine sediment metagenome TaxID=412755 RepID=X1CEG9_9ZZZZ
MGENNIFVQQNTDFDTDISGKITYTSIIESIPETSVKEPISDWKKKYKKEWRWRFIKLNKRLVVEISYIDNDSNERMYFNDLDEVLNELSC